eukprot:351534-Chlamydomonas_euryale.AAC.7
MPWSHFQHCTASTPTHTCAHTCSVARCTSSPACRFACSDNAAADRAASSLACDSLAKRPSRSAISACAAAAIAQVPVQPRVDSVERCDCGTRNCEKSGSMEVAACRVVTSLPLS